MRRRIQAAAGCVALLSSLPAAAFVSSGKSVPARDSPSTVTSFPRSSKDPTALLRRREGAAAARRRRGRAGTDLSALPVLESLSLFDALPTAASSAASSTSSLLGSIAEAGDALEVTSSTPVHSEFELLEFAELWSVLAMSCIVALLVAWEEAIEVRPLG